MNKDMVDKFLNKNVVIGLPHHELENNLFFYNGKIKDVSSDAILLLSLIHI